MHDIHIIKRRGHKEAYDERKIYASVYSASLNSHLSKADSEKIAGKISEAVTLWVGYERKEISSEDIFKKVIELLKAHNNDVSFMYATHRDLA